MAIITVEQLKSKFEGGDYPRSTDYINLIDTLAALPEGGGGGGTVVYETDQAVISMQVFG
jgi:hypothetical protein